MRLLVHSREAATDASHPHLALFEAGAAEHERLRLRRREGVAKWVVLGRVVMGGGIGEGGGVGVESHGVGDARGGTGPCGAVVRLQGRSEGLSSL